MRRLVVLLVAVGCSRQLTEIATDAAPEFLGPLSGVYESMDEAVTGEAGTIVVQFRDGLLFAPYSFDNGLPRLDMFANTLEVGAVEGDYTWVEGITDVHLELLHIFGPAARCNPSAPLPRTSAEVFGQGAACAAG